MPEGHLIHHHARAHLADLRGPLDTRSPQGRFAEEARQLDGGQIEAIEAYGKHLFYHWRDGPIVHVHLGQQGLFLHHDPPTPPPRPQVRLRIAAAGRVVDLIAPARCELLPTRDRDRLVAGLGSDPLRTDADADDVQGRLAASGAAIGAVLLDQSVVAGVGNVLRAEVLNIARIHPSRRGNSLERACVHRLWATLVGVMEQAAEEGRILTARPPGARADIPEHEARFVYRQPRCRRCGTDVEQLTVAGRTAYACPTCQPLPTRGMPRQRDGSGSASG